MILNHAVSAKMHKLTAQPLQDQPLHLLKVDDIFAQPVVQKHRLQQTVTDIQSHRRHKPLCRCVYLLQPPMTIQRDCRIRRVALQHPLHRCPHRGHLRIAQIPRTIDGRIARRRQQSVDLRLRQLQLPAKTQNHLAAGLRPSGFQKRHMSRRDLRRKRQIQLTHPAQLSPVLQLSSKITHAHLGVLP